MKKVLKAVVGLIVALAMGVAGLAGSSAAFADDAAPAATGDTTINVTDETNGVEYGAWKLFTATTSADGKSFSYTVNSTYKGAIAYGLTQAGVGGGLSYQSSDAQLQAGLRSIEKDATKVRTFADSAYKYLTGEGQQGDKPTVFTPDYTATSANGKATFTVPQGYYLIAQTSQPQGVTAVSAVILDTAGQNDLTVDSKKDTPGVEKKVDEKNDSDSSQNKDLQDKADYDIGDTVPFTLTATLPEAKTYDAYKTYKLVFHDTQSAGLTLNKDSFKLYLNTVADTNVIDAKYYTVATDNLTDGETFNITFNDVKQVPGATAASKIIVKYTSVLNTNAVIGNPGNPNKVYLEFSNNPYNEGTGKTPEDKVIVFTFKMVANKVGSDATTPLKGAGFTLYKKIDGKTDGNPAGYATVKNIPAGEATTFTFTGLDAGIYKLVETTVPAGYNKAADIDFIIKPTYNTDDPAQITDLKFYQLDGKTEITSFTVDANKGTGTTTVVNKSGTEFPSTGGMGTTLLYVGGALLVVLAGAGIVMLRRRKA